MVEVVISRTTIKFTNCIREATIMHSRKNLLSEEQTHPSVVEGVFQSHLRRTLVYSIFFLQTHNIGNNANFGISGLYHMKRQNSSNKMLSPLSIVPLEL